MENNELLFLFREHLQVLNRTEATISSYTDHTRLYLEGLGKDIKAVTASDIRAYIAGLFDYRDEKNGNKKYAAATVMLKVRSLKRFFEFLEEINLIFINPMEAIKEPKQEKRIPRTVLTQKEVTLLLEQPNLGTMAGIRNRTILEVLYTTGTRLGELVKLTIYDADLQGKLLRIDQGKGRKDRVVPLGKHSVRFLREYITKIRPRFTKGNTRSRFLFVTGEGKPLSKQVVNLMIRKCVRQSGLKKRVTAHTFRHSFATALVKNGADVTAVQKMLGHAELRTTQRYIDSLGLDLKKVHAKSHPRERDKVDRKSIKPRIKRMSHAPVKKS